MKRPTKFFRREKDNEKRPEAPHNTTQYIIDANCSSVEKNSDNYGEQDRFQFDFQHHSMAGSMFELFNGFSSMYQQRTEEENNHLESSTSQQKLIQEDQGKPVVHEELLEVEESPRLYNLGGCSWEDTQRPEIEITKNMILIAAT